MVMKTLGATRRTLLGTLALEYVFLGLIASVFGLFAGMTSAWAILTFVMETPFVFAWALAIGLALGALLVTLSVGLLATLSVLKQRPAQALRNL
jgi:putative ABC transport system permease protein